MHIIFTGNFLLLVTSCNMPRPILYMLYLYIHYMPGRSWLSSNQMAHSNMYHSFALRPSCLPAGFHILSHSECDFLLRLRHTASSRITPSDYWAILLPPRGVMWIHWIILNLKKTAAPNCPYKSFACDCPLFSIEPIWTNIEILYLAT